MKTKLFLSFFVIGLFVQTTCFRKSQNVYESKTPMSFRAGHEYIYEYNGQVASGLVDSELQEEQPQSVNNYDHESRNHQQKAVIRIQSKVKITFNSEHRATLQLEQTRIGQLNRGISDPKRVQSIEMFEKQPIDERKMTLLSLPCEFSYVDGIIQQIQFDANDKVWSRNIKRGVLNLLQINLKRKNTNDNNNNNKQWESTEEQQHQSKTEMSFTAPETTIEGNCMTTYTINDDFSNNEKNYKTNEQNNESNEKMLKKHFNVTKSINFKQCYKIADVAFGFQTQNEQSIKCMRTNAQRHQETQNQNSKMPFVSDESCDPKEVNENKLDRLSVQRFELIVDTNEDVAIKRSEALSHYVLKNSNFETSLETPSAMHTISLSELMFRSVKEVSNSGASTAPHYQLKDNSGTNSYDSLLFDNEWDTESKRFYMYGDEEISRERNPFQNVQKVNQSVNIYNRFLSTNSNKGTTYESDMVVELQRLVELLRMCSVLELEKIYFEVVNLSQNSRLEQERVNQLLANTLAMAGTRNTVYVLTQNIMNKRITYTQAAQALKNLHGLPAPSEVIVDMIENLCKNEMTHRSSYLRPICWLTFGAMVNELCRDKILHQSSQQSHLTKNQNFLVFGVQSGFEKSEVCSPYKKEAYKQTFLQQYEQSETPYEKILVLKAIGNAGLDTMVNDLERICNGQKERNPLVRVVAIDALRRLRNQMPRKIQRICLSIFQNTKERSEIRMAAISLLMSTEPEQDIVDQWIYTLSKERSEEVKMFSYQLMRNLVNSKNSRNKKIALHLKSALKLASLNEDKMRRTTSSRTMQIPIYSGENNEGVTLKVISVMSNTNMLPNYVAAGFDSIFNGEMQNDFLKVSFAQQNTNNWIENLMQFLNGNDNNDQSQTRGDRTSSQNYQRINNELQKIFSTLKIKSRQNPIYNQNENSQQNNSPLVLMSLRLNNIDHAVLLISPQNLPQAIKEVLENGKQTSLVSMMSQLFGSLQKQSRWLNVFNFNEKSATIPTSAGFPLKIRQSTPVLVNVDSSIKVLSDGKTQIQCQPQITVVHTQKMKCWSPFIETGVESMRAAELNLPINLEIQTNKNIGLRVALKLPQQKTRLFGLHTMAATFTEKGEKNLMKKIRSIYNPNLESSLPPLVEINKVFGNKVVRIPIRISGNFHLPRQMSDYSQIAQILMATENHLHVELEPRNESEMEREIVVYAKGNLFEPVSHSQHVSQLENFYNDNEQFYLDDHENINPNYYNQQQQKLEKVLMRHKEQQRQNEMYRHSLKLSIETQEQGQKQFRAEMKLNAVCDSKFVYCKLDNEIERSPIYSDETSKWTLKQTAEFLTPETVSSVYELENISEEKNQNYVAIMKMEWSAGNRNQYLNLRIHGENTQSSQILKWLKENQNKMHHEQHQFPSVFLNKFDISAKYDVNTQIKNWFGRLFEVIKVNNFWNTNSQVKHTGRENQLFIKFFINPQSPRYCNISVRTPSQDVRIVNTRLPFRSQPMSLISASQKPLNSLKQALTRLASNSRPAKCSVNQNRIATFDNVLYKIPENRCEKILAKDCSNVKSPQFIVLMKNLDENGKQKRIRVITPHEIVVCSSSKQSHTNYKSQKIVCTVNDKEVTSQSNLSPKKMNSLPIVEYNNDEQTSATINVRGVMVRLGCHCSKCMCQKIVIKLSNNHKNTQCGLCGHYDDTSSDEWRMGNNEQASNLAEFYRSYLLKSDEKECTQLKLEEFQNENKQTDRTFNSNNKESSSEQNEDNNENDLNKWSEIHNSFGGYVQEDERDEDWDRKVTQRGSEEPKMQTKILEYTDKICFSTEPVKQCLHGTTDATSDYSSSSDSEYNNTDKNEKNMKIQKFACLSRHLGEARRLQNEVRRNNQIDVSKLPLTFSHKIAEPTKCRRY